MFENIFNEKKVKELKDINLKEISFVDKPANNQDFIFFKSLNREPNSLEVMMADLCGYTDTAIVGRIENILKRLADITSEQADDIKALCLAATDIDADELSKCESLVEFAKLCPAEHDAENVVESLSGLSPEQASNTFALLKVDFNNGDALWPSLVKTYEDEEPSENLVTVNKSEKWPSLLAHVLTRKSESKSKPDLLWPSLTAR